LSTLRTILFPLHPLLDAFSTISMSTKSHWRIFHFMLANRTFEYFINCATLVNQTTIKVDIIFADHMYCTLSLWAINLCFISIILYLNVWEELFHKKQYAFFLLNILLGKWSYLHLLFLVNFAIILIKIYTFTVFWNNGTNLPISHLKHEAI
jgi:hypothetical protein